MSKKISDHFDAIADLQKVVGKAHVLVGEDVRSRSDGYPSIEPMRALCIVRPADTAEVSKVLAYCNNSRLKVVTQGGLTGLVGGARSADGDVALSIERLRAMEPIDPDGSTVVVGAGVPLQALQEHASAAGFHYAVDLGARGSATIGGTIATNAGGNSVLRYGMTREQVLGLEVVLADGTVISSLNRLIKNNSGYDTKQMFIGSEGTLGVITRAALRLRPDPGNRATAFVGLDRFGDVLAFMRKAAKLSDGTLSSFEVLWPSFIETVLLDPRHTFPLEERRNFYVLVEVVSQCPDDVLLRIVEEAWSDGIIADAAISQNLSQAESFWAIRDDIDALVSQMKPVFMYDVSLPQAAMADYVVQLEGELSERWPVCRSVIFGHIADGNLHIFITTGDPADHHEVDELVYRGLAPLGGSISAEHGIGLEKRDYLGVSKSAEEIALMARLKQALDPFDTLNPGKILV